MNMDVINISNKELPMKKSIARKAGLPLFAALMALPGKALAGEGVAEVAGSTAMYVVNNTWMLVATFLVFVMHLGFAALESGMTQAKNTVNILFKNTAIIAIGLLTYAIVGFNLMYPGDFSIAGFFGFAGFVQVRGQGLDHRQVITVIGFKAE